MKELLNSISVLVTFATATGIIYMVLNNTIGRIPPLRSMVAFRNILVKDIIFIELAVYLILHFTTFYTHW